MTADAHKHRHDHRSCQCTAYYSVGAAGISQCTRDATPYPSFYAGIKQAAGDDVQGQFVCKV